MARPNDLIAEPSAREALQPSLRRVLIVGQPGSGKSTFARALGDRTGLPVVHIDQLHWMPGWIERSPEDKTRLCREVEARVQSSGLGAI